MEKPWALAALSLMRWQVLKDGPMWVLKGCKNWAQQGSLSICSGWNIKIDGRTDMPHSHRHPTYLSNSLNATAKRRLLIKRARKQLMHVMGQSRRQFTPTGISSTPTAPPSDDAQFHEAFALCQTICAMTNKNQLGVKFTGKKFKVDTARNFQHLKILQLETQYPIVIAIQFAIAMKLTVWLARYTD